MLILQKPAELVKTPCSHMPVNKQDVVFFCCCYFDILKRIIELNNDQVDLLNMPLDSGEDHK